MYFNKFEIETINTKAQNLETLKKIVFIGKIPTFPFKFDYDKKTFYGKINNSNFEISPVIKGRNSFSPNIKGELIGDIDSKIILKMRLHFSVIVFLLCLTLLILWNIKYYSIYEDILILTLIYFITFFLYWKECKKAKVNFEKYFK